MLDNCNYFPNLRKANLQEIKLSVYIESSAKNSEQTEQTLTTEQTLLISCRIFASYNMFQVRVGMKNE